MMARLFALRRRLARAICPENDPRHAFELGKFVGQMGDDFLPVIPHPVTRRAMPLTADVFGPPKRLRTAADNAKSYDLKSGQRRRFQDSSWWILPGVFAGLSIWICFFRLIGVL